jgi:hypothetical protein
MFAAITGGIHRVVVIETLSPSRQFIFKGSVALPRGGPMQLFPPRAVRDAHGTE